MISVFSNVAPKAAHDICAHFFAGNTAESLRLQLENLPLIDALFCDVNPIPVKEALCMMGFDVGEGRLPLIPLSAEHKALLKAEMQKAGIL